MDNEIRVRTKEALEWLKEQRIVLSQKDAAIKIGYNPCVMSTILSGHGKISNRFLQKLCALNPKLNLEWLLTGHGEMLIAQVDETPVIAALSKEVDMQTLVNIIEGQTKTIGIMTDYLSKIEESHRILMQEIISLKREIEELRKKQ